MSVDKLVDSTQLDSDLTSVANAIRTKGGTSASLAFPSDFVQAIADIPTGGGTELLYPFGLYVFSNSSSGGTWQGTYQIYRNASGLSHFKIEFSGSSTSAILFINLLNGSYDIQGGVLNNKPKWFTIPSGKQSVLKLSNIVNAGGVVFAGNFRKANSSSSTSEFGTGASAHTSDVTVTVTPSTNIDASCFFLAFNPTNESAANKTVEFDISFTVDGVDYF